MKEATGELNMTVITVVAIAAVGALFTFFVWPNIQASLMTSTACSNLNSHGNYTNTTTTNGKESKITCNSYKCTVTYNGQSYTKDCSDS